MYVCRFVTSSTVEEQFITLANFRRFALALQPGLPDFSRHKIPKRGKIYQVATKVKNVHKILEISIQ
jgi:hypothetical protein